MARFTERKQRPEVREFARGQSKVGGLHFDAEGLHGLQQTLALLLRPLVDFIHLRSALGEQPAGLKDSIGERSNKSNFDIKIRSKLCQNLRKFARMH